RADADCGTEFFVRHFEARRHVHGVPMRRVVEFGSDPHIADDGLPGLNSDARASKFHRRRRGTASKSFGPRAYGDRTVDSAARVTPKVVRPMNQGVYRAPDVFVDHAAVLYHDSRHALEILVEDGNEFLGTGAVRHRGEVVDIGE